MPYTPVATRNFHNVKKKLPASLRQEIDRQVDLICEDPAIGEQKTGDLRGVFVHKFSMAGQLYLLAYWSEEDGELQDDDPSGTATLLALGGHGNFYRDLKNYLKS